MSEEKDKDTRIYDYKPIEYGGLKAMLILLPIAGYLSLIFGYFVRLLYQGQESVTVLGGLLICATIVLFFVGQLTGLSKRGWRFLCDYWIRNVRGEVLNIFLNNDNKLEALIKRDLDALSACPGELLWRVPLGGWRKKPSWLKKYHSSYYKSGWHGCGWGLKPGWAFSLRSLESLDDVNVQLCDSQGNVLTTTLLEALQYSKANSDQSFNEFFGEHRDLETQLGVEKARLNSLELAAQSALQIIQGAKRFANSQPGLNAINSLGQGLKHNLPQQAS